MRKFLVSLSLAIGLLVASSTYSTGTPSYRVYEPFVPSPDYSAAYNLVVKEGRVAEGVAKFGEVAAQNPGTTLGAVSLLRQAYWSLPENQVAIYQAVVAGYPDSHFAIKAKLSLLDIQYETLPEQWRVAADQLAQSYGGPALDDILSGQNSPQLSAQMQALDIERQLGLMPIYTELQGYISTQTKQYEAALPLALFNRQNFSQYTNANLLNPVQFNLEMLRFGTWKGEPVQVVDPDVRILSPKQGQTKGPRPKIRFQTTVGDYRFAQVDLAKVSLKVDGLDVTSQMAVRSHVRKSLKTRPNSLFERLRFKYRPTQRLNAGVHAVEVVIPTMGYSGTGPGVARANWTFQVRNGRDDVDDEQVDDGDDDGWDLQD